MAHRPPSLALIAENMPIGQLGSNICVMLQSVGLVLVGLVLVGLVLVGLVLVGLALVGLALVVLALTSLCSKTLSIQVTVGFTLAPMKT